MLMGAAIGFHLYFHQPGLNTDTVAQLFFAVGWALAGLLCGALCSACAGWLIEALMRRLLPRMPLVASGITLGCVTGLCLALDTPIESRLPSLLWPTKQQMSVQAPPPWVSPCEQPPPTDLEARKAWEPECRYTDHIASIAINTGSGDTVDGDTNHGHRGQRAYCVFAAVPAHFSTPMLW